MADLGEGPGGLPPPPTSLLWVQKEEMAEERKAGRARKPKPFVRNKLKLEKNSGLNGIRTHDLYDTGAELYQLNYQAIATAEAVHINALINRVFISFSAVQICDLSYIHLHQR